MSAGVVAGWEGVCGKCTELQTRLGDRGDLRCCATPRAQVLVGRRVVAAPRQVQLAGWQNWVYVGGLEYRQVE